MATPPDIDEEWARSLVGLRMSVPDYWWPGYNSRASNKGRIASVNFLAEGQKFFKLELDEEEGVTYGMRYDAVVRYVGALPREEEEEARRISKDDAPPEEEEAADSYIGAEDEQVEIEMEVVVEEDDKGEGRRTAGEDRGEDEVRTAGAGGGRSSPLERTLWTAEGEGGTEDGANGSDASRGESSTADGGTGRRQRPHRPASTDAAAAEENKKQDKGVGGTASGDEDAMTDILAAGRRGPSLAPSVVAAAIVTMEDCEVVRRGWLGDRSCDEQGGYNNAACRWDRGNCCPQTCEAGGKYE